MEIRVANQNKSGQQQRWNYGRGGRSTYLRSLLRLELPDQVALLGDTGVQTRDGLPWRSWWSAGGRSHARFVVQTRLLLELGLHEGKD